MIKNEALEHCLYDNEPKYRIRKNRCDLFIGDICPYYSMVNGVARCGYTYYEQLEFDFNV